MTVHASVELLEAMRGVAPAGLGLPVGGRPACGASLDVQTTLAWTWRRSDRRDEHWENTTAVTCPDCIRLYPDEIRMRMDYVAIREAS